MVRRFSMCMCLFASMACVISTNVANAGSQTVNVSLDTSYFLGRSGDVEFQLGASAGGVPITVTITAYSSTATLNGPTYNNTAINPNDPPNTYMNGDLASDTLSLYNDDSALQFAEAYQLVTTFSSFMNFDITFTGDSIGAASASSPSLTILVYDGDQNPLSVGPNGEVFVYQVDSATGNINEISYGAVPEPSTFLSLATGIAGIGLAIRRRRLA